MSKAGERECVFAAIDLKHQIKKSLEKYSRLSIVFKDPLPEKQPHVPAKQEVPHASAVTDTEWKFGTEVPESVPVADMELDPTTPHAQLAILKRKLQKYTTVIVFSFSFSYLHLFNLGFQLGMVSPQADKRVATALPRTLTSYPELQWCPLGWTCTTGRIPRLV